jgi:hypothetical protein
VQEIREHELQGVFARRQRQRGFGLAFAEVQVVLIGGERQRQIGGSVGVDEEVVVPRVVEFDAGGAMPCL